MKHTNTVWMISF